MKKRMIAWLLAACMLLGLPAALAEETALPEPDFWQRIAQEILALSADEALSFSFAAQGAEEFEALLQPAGDGISLQLTVPGLSEPVLLQADEQALYVSAEGETLSLAYEEIPVILEMMAEEADTSAAQLTEEEMEALQTLLKTYLLNVQKRIERSAVRYSSEFVGGMQNVHLYADLSALAEACVGAADELLTAGGLGSYGIDSELAEAIIDFWQETRLQAYFAVGYLRGHSLRVDVIDGSTIMKLSAGAQLGDARGTLRLTLDRTNASLDGEFELFVDDDGVLGAISMQAKGGTFGGEVTMRPATSDSGWISDDGEVTLSFEGLKRSGMFQTGVQLIYEAEEERQLIASADVSATLYEGVWMSASGEIMGEPFSVILNGDEDYGALSVAVGGRNIPFGGADLSLTLQNGRFKNLYFSVRQDTEGATSVSIDRHLFTYEDAAQLIRIVPMRRAESMRGLQVAAFDKETGEGQNARLTLTIENEPGEPFVLTGKIMMEKECLAEATLRHEAVRELPVLSAEECLQLTAEDIAALMQAPTEEYTETP